MARYVVVVVVVVEWEFGPWLGDMAAMLATKIRGLVLRSATNNSSLDRFIRLPSSVAETDVL